MRKFIDEISDDLLLSLNRDLKRRVFFLSCKSISELILPFTFSHIKGKGKAVSV
jgi:hypothetical protein